MLEPFKLAGLLFLDFFDLRPVLIHDLLHIIANGRRLDPVDREILDLFIDNVNVFAGADFLSRRRIDNCNVQLVR